MAKESQLKINIVGDASQIKKVFGQAEQAAGGFGKAIGNVGAAAGGFLVAEVGMRAVGAAVGGVKEAVFGLNNEYEAAQTRIMAFTKDQGQTADILNKVRTEASKTPFAFNEMANATAALMAPAKMANVSWEELLKTGEILAASNPMEGLEGASFALKEAVSGDFASIIERFNLSRQTINRLKDEGVPALEIVRRAMEEQGLDASLVSGMAETAAGRWATFQDTIDSLKMSLTKPIFEVLKSGLTAVQGVLDANSERMTRFAEIAGNVLANSLARAGEIISSTLVPAFDRAREAVDTFLVYYREHFEDFEDAGFFATLGFRARDLADFIQERVVPVLERLFGFLQKHAGTIATVAGVVGVLVGTFTALTSAVGFVTGVFATISGVVAAVTAAWTVLSASVAAFFAIIGLSGSSVLGGLVALLGGPVTVAIAAVAGAVALVALAWTKNWGDIQGKTAAVWAAIQPVFKAIQERFSQFVSLLLPELAAAWAVLGSKIDAVLQFVASLLETFWAGAIQPTFTAIQEFIQRHGDDIFSILSRVWNLISGTISNVTAIISDVIQLALNLIQGDWEGAWTNVKDIGQRLWDQIRLVISTAVGVLRDVLSILWDEIKFKAIDSWNGIKNTFESGKDALRAAILWPFERARDAIGGIMGGFKSALAGPWNSAASGINNFIVGMGLAVNWASRQLTGQNLFNWGGMPHIPHFARGGVHQGGLMIAGEDGPELMVQPAGTRIFSHRDTVDLFRAVNDRNPEGVPLGPNGPLGLGAGPLDSAIGIVKGMASSVADTVRKVIDKGVGWLINSAFGGLGLNTGGGAIGSFGGGVFDHVMGMAKDTITNLFETVKKALPDTVPNGNAILDMAYRTPGAYMWCEKFVGDVMDRMGLRYHRAASAAQHRGMQPLNPGTGPAGAVVFLPWDTYGHVAFSLGDGRIYGTANTPSGKGVMPAWAGAGWTATPFADGGIVTGPLFPALLGESGSEAVIPLTQFPDIIEGGLTPALTELFKPNGKAGQALGEVGDEVNQTTDAVDKANRDNIDWLAGIYNLEGINQDTTEKGLEKIDSAISDGNKRSTSTLGQILDILRDSASGARALFVTQTGGGAVSDQLSDALDPSSDVITGGLTPGMAGMLPGGANNPIVLQPTGDVVTGGLPPGMNALFGTGSVNNGDVILGSGPVGGETYNPDVITGPLPSFARGGIAMRSMFARVGDVVGGEAIIPLSKLPEILAAALDKRAGGGLTVNVNITGDISVQSRQDLDRFGNDIAGSIVAGMRRLGVA